MDETTPLVRNHKHVDSRSGRGFGARHVLGFWSFLGFINLFSIRVNLSVALVAMANTEDNISLSNECTSLRNNTTTLTQGHHHHHHHGMGYGHTFPWDLQTQGYILGAFFYGYCATQVLGGWLAGKVGGKVLFGLGILIPSLLSLLIPFAARLHIAALITVRVAQGIAQGVVYPAMHSLWGKWAPVLERSKLVTVSYAGAQLGTVAAMTGGSYLCQSHFLGGWPSVFYVFGGAGCVWSIFWFALIHDSPRKHPRISLAEKHYIERSIRDDHQNIAAPWGKIFSSRGLWAIIAAHVANDWGCFTTITCLPQYMKQVLKFDLTEDGFLSSLPYITLWFINTICGPIADFIRSRGYLSTKNTRKIMNSVGLFLPAGFMVAVGYLGCDPTLAVLFLCLGVGFSGFTLSGYSVNHLDIAPPFAGILMGITNTFGTTTGFIGPAIVGALTDHNTLLFVFFVFQQSSGQWRIFFFITSGLFLFGGTVFALFAEGEEQQWSIQASLKHRAPHVQHVQAADEGPDFEVDESGPILH